METRGLEIVPLEKCHIAKAASIIAAAFLEEPGAVAVIKRGPEKRLQILRRHFGTHLPLNLRHGLSRCALLNGDIVGAMIVTVPGKEPVTTLGMLRILLRMLFHVSPGIMWRGLRSSLDDERHRPEEPNYYLETVAVDPKFRGRGIGAAMLSYLTDLADREGILVYLSTTDPKTVPLYVKFGFETRAKTSSCGVPNCHMVRRPKES